MGNTIKIVAKKLGGDCVRSVLGFSNLVDCRVINASAVNLKVSEDFNCWRKGQITDEEFAENTARNSTCAVVATGAGPLGAMAGERIATALGAPASVPVASAIGMAAGGFAGWKLGTKFSIEQFKENIHSLLTASAPSNLTRSSRSQISSLFLFN